MNYNPQVCPCAKNGYNYNKVWTLFNILDAFPRMSWWCYSLLIDKERDTRLWTMHHLLCHWHLWYYCACKNIGSCFSKPRLTQQHREEKVCPKRFWQSKEAKEKNWQWHGTAKKSLIKQCCLSWGFRTKNDIMQHTEHIEVDVLKQHALLRVYTVVFSNVNSFIVSK